MVGQWLARTLPPADLIETYETAGVLWRAGESAKAIETLRELASQGSDAQLSEKIARHESIVSAYEAWLTDETLEHLLALREQLREPLDEFYLKATEEAFASQRHLVVEQLDATFNRASKFWQSYHQAGGIPSLLRLETPISKQFEEQSGLLSSAFGELQKGGRQREVLGIDLSAEWIALEVDILNEIKRQRFRLGGLGNLMDKSVVNRKLDLLPDVEE